MTAASVFESERQSRTTRIAASEWDDIYAYVESEFEIYDKRVQKQLDVAKSDSGLALAMANSIKEHIDEVHNDTSRRLRVLEEAIKSISGGDSQIHSSSGYGYWAVFSFVAPSEIAIAVYVLVMIFRRYFNVTVNRTGARSETAGAGASSGDIEMGTINLAMTSSVSRPQCIASCSTAHAIEEGTGRRLTNESDNSETVIFQSERGGIKLDRKTFKMSDILNK